MAIALAIHGGAGPRVPEGERARRLEAGLAAALRAGHAILATGGTALDAVQAAVCVLEDHGGFNAGRGGVPTEGGHVELDASIMDGRDRGLGAVAAIRSVPNPVRAARALLGEGQHALLAGDGALAFAREHGLEEALAAARRTGSEPAARFSTGDGDRRAVAPIGRRPDDEAEIASPGTVGAVALDAAGHLAAATSTGGRTGQRHGRVGDSPLAGAGVWADDATAAVSCTGHGEAFMRAAVAHEVDALMRHRHLPLDAACRVALSGVERYGGEGGLIALDAGGNLAMPYSSASMLRGHRIGSGPAHVAL